MRVKHRNAESAQLIRSIDYSHFDLSSLISMARMQSVPKEESKSLMCRPGIKPGTFHLPGEYMTGNAVALSSLDASHLIHGCL